MRSPSPHLSIRSEGDGGATISKSVATCLVAPQLLRIMRERRRATPVQDVVITVPPEISFFSCTSPCVYIPHTATLIDANCSYQPICTIPHPNFLEAHFRPQRRQNLILPFDILVDHYDGSQRSSSVLWLIARKAEGLSERCPLYVVLSPPHLNHRLLTSTT